MFIMGKETPYFSHDYYSRTSDEMQVLIEDFGPAGYGIFWALIEILHEEETHEIELTEIFFRSFAKQLSTSVEQVQQVVQSCVLYKLFLQTENKITSNRVNRNIEMRAEISESRSKAGKASAAKRALNKENLTSVEHLSTDVQQNPTKEIGRAHV